LRGGRASRLRCFRRLSKAPPATQRLPLARWLICTSGETSVLSDLGRLTLNAPLRIWTDLSRRFLGQLTYPYGELAPAMDAPPQLRWNKFDLRVDVDSWRDQCSIPFVLSLSVTLPLSAVDHFQADFSPVGCFALASRLPPCLYAMRFNGRGTLRASFHRAGEATA